MLRRAAFAFLLPVALLAVACVQETKPLPILQATQAATEIPADQLLDVGVHLLDPGVPKEIEENPDRAEKARVYPEIRRAEARFIAMQLRDTLESSAQWATVRVVPSTVNSFDVTVDGRILESDGTSLRLAVTAVDATGLVWIKDRQYESVADTRAYKDGYTGGRDPFENIYVAIANDLLAARKLQDPAAIANIRRVSELRFANDFAPVAFGQYLKHDAKTGRYSVLRLPAEDDVLLGRVRQIRERDYNMIDTVSEHYSAFSERIEEPYTSWRRYTYDELKAEEKIKSQGRARMLMGAAAIAAAIFVPSNCGSSTCSRAVGAARYGALAGGVAAGISGYRKLEEAKIHSETLKELSGSFESEAAPLVVDVEGRALRLTGTAEQQYAEWRKLLHELYREETGLVPVAPAAEAAEAGTQAGGTG